MGLLIGLAADVLFGYQSIQGSFLSGGLPDVAYMLSWTAFAWAGYAEMARKNQPVIRGRRAGETVES